MQRMDGYRADVGIGKIALLSHEWPRVVTALAGKEDVALGQDHLIPSFQRQQAVSENSSDSLRGQRQKQAQETSVSGEAALRASQRLGAAGRGSAALTSLL